jgi:TetR/AcrR family transcriptional regulator
MKRGRKRAENPDTARRILDAAERHFAAHGLAGARTDQIAISAHANKAMLYYYFGDKQRLHRAVLENLIRQVRPGFESAASRAATPRQRILAFVDAYFDFRAAHPRFPQILMWMMMSAPAEARWLARTHFLPGHRLLQRVIRDGITHGEFRPVDPKQTVITLIAMISFYFSSSVMQSEILQKNAFSPRAVAERKRAVIDFLEHGLFLPEKRPA